MKFFNVILKMIKQTWNSSPVGFLCFLLSSFLFTFLLIADLHFVRLLINRLPDFSIGTIPVKPVLYLIIVLGSVNIIDTLMNGAMNLLYEFLSNRTTGDLAEKMHVKVSRLGLIRFESSILYNDVEKAVHGRNLGFSAMEEVVFAIIFHGGYFFFLILYFVRLRPELVIGITASFLPVAVSRYIRAAAFYKTENRTARYRREVNRYESYMTDRRYAKETRTSGSVPFFENLYLGSIRKYNREQLRTEARTGLMDLGLKVLTFTGYAGMLLLLVYYLLTNKITAGLFGAVFFAMESIFKWFEEAFDRIGRSLKNAKLAGNYFTFLDLPERQEGSGKAPYREGITMDSVSFTYPGGSAPVLSDINLQIHPGEKIALVGPNGAGKSTLVKVLTGLLEPQSGKVRIGGKNPVGCSRNDLSAVFQNFQKYRLTLGDNTGISEHERYRSDRSGVEPALKQAGFDPGQLPRGIDTVLSKEFGGTDLSGGQWQRVAAARGLYRVSNLIILDEPTAALDPLEETRIYQKFLELTRGKTALLVTHRLGSVKGASRILVMEAGRITERGTHRELMEQQGLYRRMFSSQARWYRT
jgi:ATP-binding cassette subfamily B protein